MDSSLAEQGCRQTQCGSNIPPLGFQLLAFSCVFPLECPLYDTLAHSTRAWLLVTQTHLPTRALVRSLTRVHLICVYMCIYVETVRARTYGQKDECLYEPGNMTRGND